MSFDGLMLHHVIKDMEKSIKNARITKIYQLSQFDLLFNVRDRKNKTFMMSVSARYTRMHITENTYEKPLHPPMFCMFLRKHLEGAIIESIAQHGNDRVATFTLKATNELGDLTRKHILFEALGKDANIIVTDADMKILDALKHNSPFDQGVRTIAPGAIYTYPEDDRINPYNEAALTSLFKTKHLESKRDYLKALSGVSPQFIEAFLARRHLNEDAASVFMSMIHETNYQIIENDKAYYSFYDMPHIEGERAYYENTTQLFDAFFYDRDLYDKRKQKAKDLTQFVKRQLEKLEMKKAKLMSELQNTNKQDTYKLFGEMILSYQHEITKGDRELTCLNYYDNKEITIPLDPKKTPAENSAYYFKRYKKIKKGVPYIKRELLRAKEELDYFMLIEDQLAHANLQDLEEIREELADKRYLTAQKQAKRKRKKRYTIYKDPLGIEIMVGKNNIQNAYITHDVAAHYHVWFHVQNAPGSHVVVKHALPLEETTIRTAAQLAAYYSKLKESSSVPIDYTEVKHIKKIPGKHGCFVRYEGQKTIYIDPDPSFIQSLEQKNIS